MRTEDGSIIYKCLNGDPEAFAILIDKYKAGIYAYVCAKIKNMDDAEDVTQEVFIRAYRDLHKLRRWDSFAYWLYAIATYQCRNWLRSKSRRPDHEFIEDQEPSKLEKILADPAIESYQEKQLDESLHEALNSLPEIYREVLMLYYMGGMNSEQIAVVLAKSPENIRQRLSRARMLLKEEVISMMPTSLPQHRLQASFTFRMVEAIKRIKIHPFSQSQGIPWGLALVTGAIFTVLSLNPNITRMFEIGIPPNSSLPAESRVLRVGEIPVNVLKVSDKAILAGNVNNVNPQQFDAQNAFLMAPQADGGKWVEKAEMLNPRGNCSASVVNGKIYAIGGTSNGKVPTATVEEYDPKNNTWTRKSSMPEPISDFSACVLNDKIYAVGGWGAIDEISTLFEYNPTKDVWAKKSNMLKARHSLCAETVNGKIYAIGGSFGPAPTRTAVVEEYDSEKDKWTRKTDMPTERDIFCTAVINDKIYAFGGAIDNKTPSSAMEVYDPKIDKWQKMNDIPAFVPLVYSTATILDDKVYFIGGNLAANTPCAQFVEYDPIKDKWTKKLDMPFKRSLHSSVELNGKIYVIGGWTENNQVVATLEEYTPEGWQTVVPNGKLPNTWGKIKTK